VQMTRIRAVEIENFRSIKRCTWFPRPGINCLIGPGDSGKSTLLEAIDLCLGARRNWQFTDADFHALDADSPIRIAVTIGDLDASFRRIEGRGSLVRSFNADSKTIEDEPEKSAEEVLTVVLTVRGSLEPEWSWYSQRADDEDVTRGVSWADRQRLSPTWVGAHPAGNLAWRRGSVLTRLSDERADVADALAKAARLARKGFGEASIEQLGTTLSIVGDTARELGVPVGANVKAMLDPQSVTFSGGTIALHNEQGVPLAALGTGSARLLIVGLQRRAAQSTILLVDEVETGLEPHRIIRLIGSLGAKEDPPPLQVFMTTHSPAAIRELSAKQLFVMRREGIEHVCREVGEEIQGTIRTHPEAFLARSVLVCEGATEVGFVRGVDRARSGESLYAVGVALVNAGGVDKIYAPAQAFLELGYRTATLRDDDRQPKAEDESKFSAKGGTVHKWRPTRSIEEELFQSLSDSGVSHMVAQAVELHGAKRVDEHIVTASNAQCSLPGCQRGIDPAKRKVLSDACRLGGWFKSVGKMETVASRVVWSELGDADVGFRQVVLELFRWVKDEA
jgi:putative ATP-dependent endonuclease of OLD family